MMRFSAAYYREKRAQESIELARRSFERQRQVNRRWRHKNPNRNPAELLAAWDKNKVKTAKDYSQLIVQFMSTFDGVSEANAMMRHGLEAPDAEIALDSFHDLAFNTFTLRMFEMFSAQCGLSQYSRELVLQRLVPMIFAAPTRPKAQFDMATVPLESQPTPKTRER